MQTCLPAQVEKRRREVQNKLELLCTKAKSQLKVARTKTKDYECKIEGLLEKDSVRKMYFEKARAVSRTESFHLTPLTQLVLSSKYKVYNPFKITLINVIFQIYRSETTLLKNMLVALGATTITHGWCLGRNAQIRGR